MGFVSGKIIKLKGKLNPTDTSLKADIDIGITSGRFYFNNDLQEEWIDFTGVAASGDDFVYSNLVRGLSQTTDPAIAGTGKTWIAGNSGVLVAMHDQLPDKQGNNVFEGDNTFEGETTTEETLITEKGVAATEYVNIAARDAALGGDGVATKNYTAIKAGSIYYNYNLSTSQWESIDTGTVTPDGSEIIAGKFQLSTNAQQATSESIGSSGARLIVPTDQLVKSSSGSGDENKVAILNADGKLDTGFVDYTGAISSYTLGEDMTALDQAVLQTDGNVYKWDGYIDSGTEYVSGGTINSSRIVSIDTNKVVTAYIETVSDDLFLIAGTISSGVITYGTPVTVDASVATGFDLSLVKLDTDSGLIMYHDGAGTVFRGCPFTVSGTTITVGTPVIINATAAFALSVFECCIIDTNKVLFHYGSGAATADCTVRVGIVSGNVLTLGTEDLDWNGVAVKEVKCCKLDTDKALLTAVDTSDNIVTAGCTVSGTTITVDTANKDTYFGAAVRHSVYQISTDLAIIAFDETDIKAFYVSVTTTTPVIQTAHTIVSGTTLSINPGLPLVILNSGIYGIQHSIDKITYFTTNTTTYVMTTLSTVDYGVSIGSSIDLSASNAIPDGTGCFYMNDKALSSKKTYCLNYNSHYLLGILQETGTIGQSKQVSTNGQISYGHSSLNIGQKYYSNYDGIYTLDAIALGVIRGQISMISKAVSATTMLVNIPYEDL